MKNILALAVLALFIFGCSSTPPQPPPDKNARNDAPDMPGVAKAEMKNTGNLDTGYRDNKRRLELAILARDKYMDIMRNAKSVEEADQAKEGLDRAQQDVEDLQLELEEKPQVKFEHKTPIYGPLGWVLLITEFTIQHLYIMFEL